MLKFDHLLLARRDPHEVARFRAYLLDVREEQVEEFGVLHEDDGSCCRREPWPRTRDAIVAAVNPPAGLMPSTSSLSRATPMATGDPNTGGGDCSARTWECRGETPASKTTREHNHDRDTS